MKNFMESFAEKHPKAAQWIREGGLFVLDEELYGKLCGKASQSRAVDP